MKGNAMSEQPPVQPPNPPPNQPTQGNPPTQPMPASPSAPPVGATASPAPADPPRTNTWHQVTSTSGRRWALAISAGAVALLLIVGIGVAGLLVVRHQDRGGLLGNGQDGQFLRENGPGNGRGNGNGNGKGPSNDRGPGADDRQDRRNPPGMPGGRARDLGGLGSLLGGTALHGAVTATVNGSVQSLVFQGGEVTAVTETSITLKSSDGFVGTYGRTAATRSRGAAPVKGGQAFVVARASDKVALTTVALRATTGVGPSS